MKFYLHVLVVLAINAKIANMLISTIQNVTWPNYSKALYDINNKNELQIQQGMDSRHMQQVNFLTRIVLGEHPSQCKHSYR